MSSPIVFMIKFDILTFEFIMFNPAYNSKPFILGLFKFCISVYFISVLFSKQIILPGFILDPSILTGLLLF